MKVDERWGDALPGLGVGEDPVGRVLDILEPVQGFAGNSRQDGEVLFSFKMTVELQFFKQNVSCVKDSSNLLA